MNLIEFVHYVMNLLRRGPEKVETSQVAGASRPLFQGNSLTRHRLVINNAVMGELGRITGGLATGEVLSNGISRRVGNISFEPMLIECPMQVAPFVSRMLSKTGYEQTKTSGAIMFIDKQDTQVFYQIQFNDAVCSQIHLPEFSKNRVKPVSISVKLAKTRTVLLPAPLTFPRSMESSSPNSALTSWSSDNFSLVINGLVNSSSAIIHIEPITITPSVNKRGIISSWGCSHLIVTIPTRQAKEMLEWYRSALEGNNVVANTKEGQLIIAGGFITINLSHISVFNLHEKSENSGEEDAIIVSMCVGSGEFV